MIGATIAIGAAVTLVGSGAFIFSMEPASLGTLMIGILVFVGGLLMRAPKRTSLVGHLVVVVTFIGMLTSASSLPRTIKLISGASIDSPAASIAATALGLLCLLHVTMSVRWFLARRSLKKS